MIDRFTGNPALTVSELIAELQKHPGDKPVVAFYDGRQHTLVGEVVSATVEHADWCDWETFSVVALNDAQNMPEVEGFADRFGT